MKQQISFKQYRTIDLAILMVVMAVSQFLIWMASSSWFPDQLYIVSPVGAMVALVMMRWGVWAGIHALAGGLIYTALAGGGWQQYLIYGVGNLLSLGALLMLRIFGKERVRQDAFLTLAFAFCVQVLMQVGRGLLAMALGHTMGITGGIWEAGWGFITTDSLSIIFTLFITWIVRRIDGLFEDQKHYLLRIQDEHQNEGRGPN